MGPQKYKALNSCFQYLENYFRRFRQQSEWHAVVLSIYLISRNSIMDYLPILDFFI